VSDETLIQGPNSTNAPRQELFAGRYELQSLLGKGAMGTVYRARDTLVGDVVALKTLDLGQGAGPDVLERFRREVRLARRISHPHVARMHDLGEDSGRSFLTMELIEGSDLKGLLDRERPLAPTRAARIALAVCEGLAAAHAAGVVHRDLKPGNVLVETSGRVVLTDFGIARALVDSATAHTQGLVGTPMYMAPEQVSGGSTDARTDLYAVGLMLYEMLTGERPFTGDSVLAVAMARLRQPPPDPRARVPGVPEALAGLVLRCAAREPEERPASALEIAQVLRSWLTQAGELLAPSVVTPGPSLPSSPPESSSVTGLSTPQTLRGTSTLGLGNQGVAILPLRFLGPKEQEYLGDTLTDSLIDVLSRTRGLRVPGSGTTARFRTERDPRTVGRELNVGFVVDGMVQSAGTQLRLSARLVEVATGTQLWSRRFEDASQDVLALQDRLSQRVAEALRQELLIATWSHTAPPDALSLFRQAFVERYQPGASPDVPLEMLESCLQQAPDFVPALALHALLSLRRWFQRTVEPGRDWAGEARASMARAGQRAPELAETLLARAMLAVQDGEWRKAVIAVRSALDAAPTFSEALQYLGSLQCEAGRVDEGLPRLRLAYELNPNLGMALFELARCSALRGRMEEYREAWEKLAAFSAFRIPSLMLRMRVAAWRGDRETLLQSKKAFEEEHGAASLNGLRYSTVVLGEQEPLSILPAIDAMLARPLNPRFAALLCQLVSEQLCLTGHADKALGYFLRAADTALIDLEWIDRCPALTSLRVLPGFAEGRKKVRARVEAIWGA
jgi:serine/threonine-protein kinase